MVQSAGATNSGGNPNDIWHKPINTHPLCISTTETPDQIRERSLKAREIGKTVIKGYYETRGNTGIKIKMTDYERFGGKENIIASF